jgi:hypothetical protein
MERSRGREVEINKVDIFFELLSAVYGRSKMLAQWPTERDEQIIRALVTDKIETMDISEINAAIDNARTMKAQEQDGWSWPDVDLILAGSKRHLNASHRLFLPEPERVLPTPAERAELMRKLREEAGI